MPKRRLIVQGIRGIPANHGGFETFAEKLALYLAERDWDVTVFCQDNHESKKVDIENWKGISLVHIPVTDQGALGRFFFDFKSIWYSRKFDGIVLTLGYNTAILNVIYWVMGVRNVINMDGFEWKRKKWPLVIKIWFWLNEKVAFMSGCHLIADHPLIHDYLVKFVSENRVSTIPYGADTITTPSSSALEKFNLAPSGYALLVARIEPENSVLEIVKAFSQRVRTLKLVVLGSLDGNNSYHCNVKRSASASVLFPGAIYDSDIVSTLRYYCAYHIHGHQVGGTNPSLVEALGASSAVLAHDNGFNRWVAGKSALYFGDEQDCEQLISKLEDESALLDKMGAAAIARKEEAFNWDDVLRNYEIVLSTVLSK